MRTRFLVPLACSLLLALPAASPPQATTLGEQVVTLPLENGLGQRVLYLAPARPRATLVMLPGGTGDLGLQRDGDLRHDDNFVVRTRAAWVDRGYAVLIPDTVDQANLRGLRGTPAYASVVATLAGYVHARSAAPVFLIGTSQGTIAAVNGAAHLPPALLAGLVLTESVSVPGRLSTETVFDADPQNVRVPALVVANRDDTCPVAPPTMARHIAAAMVHSPDVRVLMVAGGAERSTNPCGSLSPHGYLGIEQQVIAAIDAWLHAHGG